MREFLETVTEVQSPSITFELELCQDKAQRLSEAVEYLSKKLEPILASIGDSKGSIPEGMVKQATSPSRIVDTARSLNNRLDSILSSLQQLPSYIQL